MVSKDKYYERKAAGLCTKCGGSREGSPSKARCLACHNKLKNKQKEKETQEQDKVEEKSEKDTSKNNIEILKKAALLSKATSAPKLCGLCGEAVGSFNLFCQKCIKITTFTKYDAVSRYDSKCNNCIESDLKKLKIVSSEIGIAMKHKDQDLYKLICYRRVPPINYKVQCHTCYWSDNIAYVKNLKAIFKQRGVYDGFIDDEDVIDLS